MADLLAVGDAIARIVAGATPVDAETVPLDAADGRTLAAPLAALRQAARRHFERELSFAAVGGQLRRTYADVRELR